MCLYLAGRRLIIPPGLHRVHGLVAVVPGVQLLVAWVVVDAAVAGVALWEEYHRAFVTAEEREGVTETVVFFLITSAQFRYFK